VKREVYYLATEVYDDYDNMEDRMNPGYDCFAKGFIAVCIDTPIQEERNV
jgi:hypothetical protein